MSISPKGKRKHIYNNETYYWFVRKNSEGIPRIHIISDDKKINLERAVFDTEVPVTGAYINGLAGEMAQEKYGSISMTASDTAANIAGAINSIGGES